MNEEEIDKSRTSSKYVHVAGPFVIPVSILADRSVATLEAVVEYLKDQRSLTYHQIAELLQRDDRTIWTCYHRAKKKREQHG